MGALWYDDKEVSQFIGCRVITYVSRGVKHDSAAPQSRNEHIHSRGMTWPVTTVFGRDYCSVTGLDTLVNCAHHAR